jgi:hypothetical protein
VRQLLSFTRLWILAVPLTLTLVGAAMNQAVLIANHDKFPVMLNERKTDHIEPDEWGIVDNEAHCVMTRQTHLNFLADYLDFKTAIYSPGDLLLMLADYLSPFAPFVWGLFLLTDKLRGV